MVDPLNALLNLVIVDRLTGGALLGGGPPRRKRRKKIVIVVPSVSLPIYTALGGYPGVGR